MKKTMSLILALILAASLASACAATNAETATSAGVLPDNLSELVENAVKIELSDEGVSISDELAAYTANDVVYYEEGRGIAYGAGAQSDEHSAEEAAAHTVVHIVKPGDYLISGTLSKGQIAVDLGEEAENDENAVVTLILDNANITCTVAPAIIFYNVYECGDKENAQMIVNTEKAGANVLLAEGSVNTLNGSYVAKIYKEATLNEDGTEVLSSEKLHKYDGTLYSKMSMNIYGNTGRLTVNAENEGVDSELHLTVYGGIIDITSGDDGINTNEDNLSVTTINGGDITIKVDGAEGDGIDSNGWLVINGGSVKAYACGSSGDSGIDSDLGIYLNGGTVVATGNMLDQIAGGDLKYAVFNLREKQTAGVEYTVTDEKGKSLLTFKAENEFTTLIAALPEMTDGSFTLLKDGEEVASSGQGGGFGGRGAPGERPDGKDFDGQTQQGGFPGGKKHDGKDFDGQTPQGERPEGKDFDGKFPQGERPDGKDFDGQPPQGQSPEGERPDLKLPQGEAPNGEKS